MVVGSKGGAKSLQTVPLSTSFLDDNNILFTSQYGFREKHSTQCAILDTVNIIQQHRFKIIHLWDHY